MKHFYIVICSVIQSYFRCMNLTNDQNLLDMLKIWKFYIGRWQEGEVGWNNDIQVTDEQIQIAPVSWVKKDLNCISDSWFDNAFVSVLCQRIPELYDHNVCFMKKLKNFEDNAILRMIDWLLVFIVIYSNLV